MTIQTIVKENSVIMLENWQWQDNKAAELDGLGLSKISFKTTDKKEICTVCFLAKYMWPDIIWNRRPGPDAWTKQFPKFEIKSHTEPGVKDLSPSSFSGCFSDQNEMVRQLTVLDFDAICFSVFVRHWIMMPLASITVTSVRGIEIAKNAIKMSQIKLLNNAEWNRENLKKTAKNINRASISFAKPEMKDFKDDDVICFLMDKKISLSELMRLIIESGKGELLKRTKNFGQNFKSSMEKKTMDYDELIREIRSAKSLGLEPNETMVLAGETLVSATKDHEKEEIRKAKLLLKKVGFKVLDKIETWEQAKKYLPTPKKTKRGRKGVSDLRIKNALEAELASGGKIRGLKFRVAQKLWSGYHNGGQEYRRIRKVIEQYNFPIPKKA